MIPVMAFVPAAPAALPRTSYGGSRTSCSARASSFTSRGAFAGARARPSRAARQVVRAAVDNGLAAAAAAAAPKRVLVLGGDGFCGWPTSLYLSELGHDVIVVDNLSRRKIDLELECESLTPIQSMTERLGAWQSVSGRDVRFVYLDVAHEYDRLLDLIIREKPDAIVHFAEQRAAPYSMKGSRQKRYTVDNNVGGTHNLLAAIVESGLDIHVVHLGTMGVYGYGTSGGEIPEGYINVVLPGGRQSRILHPSYPGSVYHATKCLDQILFQFYQKNDSLRITDLHQGIVWGTNTAQTRKDERLINRFDYDSDYGTVLNRFLMQAALGVPLTVYGTGGQTRAFIHIQDTAKCISLAIANPPEPGAQVEIFNQVAETHRVRDLANLISEKTGCEVKNITNPRNESAENELDVANRKFRSLGLNPTTLEVGLLDEVVSIADKYKERCDKSKILPNSFWNKTRRRECEEFGLSSFDVGAYSVAEEDAMLYSLSKGDVATMEKLRAVLKGS
ncbi:UDP-sulfoquinovose synthase, chloroplastic, SQD1 [Chondrus crispus]|uniref:UDP-sulfoquinovose synthase, chloroplastic, SQD1 n=1 Tax=Chondrus crispus TaxID=2769 RepID=R7QA54_CHOCR|nr:UDP-sulfoquinovose synthase, chloroplastic, SQD1 [Chondrus crispus]CDF35402.1 UDP-sulfoquinovose synthase, chloroplastic, SQD1 [Chondrus crispus]|eukprot:XP_005715221.1 UDP-sulfoquinovose synthase, chloroplastic, SQD1 [Chondrus crispus]